MTDLMPIESLWTAKDVAKFLRASRSWVYQRAESGELPSLRIGGMLRFEPESIVAFARRGQSAPARLTNRST